MAFWAIEVIPGKGYTVVPPFDLHLTQIVLPASAKDKGRSVVEAKLDDKSFAVGALKLDLQENISIDLIFEAGKQIIFSVSGNNNIQLLGYYIDDNHDNGFDDDDEMDGLGFDGEDEEIDSDEDDSDDDDEDDLEDDGVNEEALTSATLKGLQQKRKAEEAQVNGAKKAKVEPQQQQQQKPKAEQKPQTPKGEQKPQQQQQKTPQQPKSEQKPQQPKSDQKPQQPKGEQRPQTPGQQQQQQKTPQQPKGEQQKEPSEGHTRMVNGVKIETKTIGLGAIAQVGRKVSVMYTGKLENGKVFDKSVSPFKFTLGAGEVIQGWDIGVAGMRVGEKRKLTIPANKGYGARGAPPDIPKNATLLFDVELVRV